MSPATNQKPRHNRSDKTARREVQRKGDEAFDTHSDKERAFGIVASVSAEGDEGNHGENDSRHAQFR